MPDFREAYELPEGLYRRSVPAFDDKVLRELLVNALVHRPYTQRGDIFLNLHPDRLEMVNPGRLPLGVTPQVIALIDSADQRFHLSTPRAGLRPARPLRGSRKLGTARRFLESQRKRITLGVLAWPIRSKPLDRAADAPRHAAPSP